MNTRSYGYDILQRQRFILRAQGLQHGFCTSAAYIIAKSPANVQYKKQLPAL